MKKVIIPVIGLLTAVSMLLAGCGGTPKPPVKNTVDLEKLVANGQTVDQVYALMTASLKGTSVLYQATNVEKADTGWVISSKVGGFAAGETGDYQVLFFEPAKTGGQSFAIFFKANAVSGTAWFSAQSAPTIENLLQGK